MNVEVSKDVIDGMVGEPILERRKTQINYAGLTVEKLSIGDHIHFTDTDIFGQKVKMVIVLDE